MEIDLNQVLTESKKHVIVANNLFHTIQDSVGFKSLYNQKVLEPLYPTQFFIAHESIETNRKEVPTWTHLVQSKYLIPKQPID
jgi:hypothetical protein